ncbi:DUF1559 family PulG-like putative transporter [Gimesia algae]|uniref:Uncharacterized protein n=1 Tax=Gimesia algae TaxID=2527971 RepID=A0A517VG32_9PLAN|nr:DUF1559 domain-containing protein [Gimesia algae]QDT91960.1 hypothetical protein Pan161_36240 [Gimesia algae]
MSLWYIKRDNQITGPLTRQQLEDFVAAGEVIESDLIRQEDSQEFFPASLLPGLFIDIDDTKPAFEVRSSRVPALLLVLFLILAIGFSLPAFQQGRSYQRSVTINNMKQIGLALHNYSFNSKEPMTLQVFPPGAMTNPQEKPLHSWQALILPYLDQQFYYNQIDLSKPWNARDNQKPFQQEVPVYLNPKNEARRSSDGYALSHYAGNELVLKPNVGMPFNEIRDGMSNTILAVEIGEQFKPWGDPTSLTVPEKVIGPNRNSPSTGGTIVLLADGAVRFIPEDIDPEILKALSTPAGGEEIGEY